MNGPFLIIVWQINCGIFVLFSIICYPVRSAVRVHLEWRVRDMAPATQPRSNIRVSIYFYVFLFLVFLCIFSCQICSYSAKTSQRLTEHLRTHTGDAPYVCFVCQRSFKIKSDLTRHHRKHSDEKPFPCPHCDFRCSLKGLIHLRVVLTSWCAKRVSSVFRQPAQTCWKVFCSAGSRRAWRHDSCKANVE